MLVKSRQVAVKDFGRAKVGDPSLVGVEHVIRLRYSVAGIETLATFTSVAENGRVAVCPLLSESLRSKSMARFLDVGI